MKYALVIIMVFALLFGSVGCKSISEAKITESPSVSAAAASPDGHLLTVITKHGVIPSALISPDESNDNNALFKFAFKEGMSGIEYLDHLEKITLDFGDNLPDSISAEDIFLNKKGEMLYTYRETKAVALAIEDRNFCFILRQSMNSLLSSDFGGLDIRGFKITARWGSDTYVYAFVIKTNSYCNPLDAQ